MLLTLTVILGGVVAILLMLNAARGPSASKILKRRIEMVKERHGDVIAANAQAQIRKSDEEFEGLKKRSAAEIAALNADVAARKKELEQARRDAAERVSRLEAQSAAALKQAKPTTLEWLSTARNYARYANEAGQYDEVLEFLKAFGKA